MRFHKYLLMIEQLSLSNSLWSVQNVWWLSKPVAQPSAPLPWCRVRRRQVVWSRRASQYPWWVCQPQLYIMRSHKKSHKDGLVPIRPAQHRQEVVPRPFHLWLHCGSKCHLESSGGNRGHQCFRAVRVRQQHVHFTNIFHNTSTHMYIVRNIHVKWAKYVLKCMSPQQLGLLQSELQSSMSLAFERYIFHPRSQLISAPGVGAVGVSFASLGSGWSAVSVLSFAAAAAAWALAAALAAAAAAGPRLLPGGGPGALAAGPRDLLRPRVSSRPAAACSLSFWSRSRAAGALGIGGLGEKWRGAKVTRLQTPC